MSNDDDNTFGGDGMDEIDAMSAAYALNALTDPERTLFEERLHDNPDLQREVAELNETALLLGRAVPPVTPSAGLRSSILDLLDSTPQLPALTLVPPVADRAQDAAVLPPETSPRATGPAVVTVGEVASGELLRPTPLAHQRWFLRPAALLAGAAAAAALFFGGGAILNQHQPAPVVSQIAGPTANSSTDASRILAASDVQHASAKIAAGGTATVYWSAALGQSAVVLDGVATLPTSKTYQLWYINGAVIKSAGLVSTKSGTLTQVLKGDLTSGATVGITVEPKGGSKQPTTTPIAAIPV
ncbi:anti-sigma factor [Frondihabitans australicus]|uniref:Regulator of SigK n=1 Tax=Frondihabitans australicus TaxID=386892 RepID=A0A495IJ12_9MICO|nr:anti-sigma factor [Frondihabitans australicus]RKR75398.1 anti-sigma-K factor RskA [Frondihabitans australicus]